MAAPKWLSNWFNHSKEVPLDPAVCTTVFASASEHYARRERTQLAFLNFCEQKVGFWDFQIDWLAEKTKKLPLNVASLLLNWSAKQLAKIVKESSSDLSKVSLRLKFKRFDSNSLISTVRLQTVRMVWLKKFWRTFLERNTFYEKLRSSPSEQSESGDRERSLFEIENLVCVCKCSVYWFSLAERTAEHLMLSFLN